MCLFFFSVFIIIIIVTIVLLGIHFGTYDDVFFASWFFGVVLWIDDDKGWVFGVGCYRRQVGFVVLFFLVVDGIGVDVFAIVGCVLLLSFKLFPDALFGEKGSLSACLFFLSLASFLEIVECKVELVDKEHQQEEGEDDDDTSFADVVGQNGIEPQADSPSEDGALGCHGGYECEEQRHPYQAKKGPFPNAPHLDFGGLCKT